MASDGAALIERFNEGWNDRDLEVVLTCIDAEMEFDWSDSMGPLQGVYLGRDGMTQFWNETWDAWDEFVIEVAEIIELAPDRIVTPTLVRGRGRGSGVDVEAGGAMSWKLRDGKIVAGRFFQSRAEALKAASSETARKAG